MVEQKERGKQKQRAKRKGEGRQAACSISNTLHPRTSKFSTASFPTIFTDSVKNKANKEHDNKRFGGREKKSHNLQTPVVNY